ncbi:hypothetical protein Tco_0484704, partial [Tanacetum coccineum]
SGAGLDVDKAKIDVISKLPPPTNVKGQKGTENVTVDHLSRIDNDEISDDSDVDDNFPGETLMKITIKDTPWFADFANYLVVAVYYVSKWAEAQALPTNDARVVISLLKKLFCHFGNGYSRKETKRKPKPSTEWKGQSRRYNLDVFPYFPPAKPLGTLAKIISSTLLFPPSCIKSMLAIPHLSQVSSMAEIVSKEAQKKLKAGICFRLTSHNKHTLFLSLQRSTSCKSPKKKTSAINRAFCKPLRHLSFI